jgi:plastocyanin
MATQRSTIRTVSTTAAAALSLVLAPCGSGSSPSSATSSSNSASTAANTTKAPLTGKISVAISNYSYHPATITVAPGTTVTFTNHDQTAHTATTAGSGFDTGTLKQGHRSSIQVGKRGSYTYYCQFHAFMRVTIIVK